ncbi:hypothetical protein L249_4863 [Ophiocordyceps polyrhachis-furcata BCC 54312]|uniref:Uncharacterized protein n=1 Tax=Ophiocordyceps polyrhachis-furcata BCC 54312 TaxID=1330021 RepID=A0A367L2F4_9HYPO|nr:hypothetical protein L249_4863 [Ophiocordyceps polyrhachis-furcata BCC 54312]
MQRSAKGYLRPYNRGDVHDKGRDLCDVRAAINAIKNYMPLRYEDYMHRLADQKPPTKIEILAFFQSYADLIDNTKKDAFSANLSGSGTKTQDRGRGRGRRGRGRGRRGRGSQGGRPSSSPSIIIGPNGRRETNHGFRFIEISENTTLDPFRAANSGDLLP